MGKVNLAVEGYKLRQTGEQIQKILDAVELLNMTDTKELLELLKDIKEYDNSDDEQDIGHQLVNALNNMVNEKEVQTSVNSSTYPPSSQAVKSAIADEARIREIQDNQLAQDLHTETGARINGDSQLRGEITEHAGASPIDHPDGSVTSAKIASGAIHEGHIAMGAITDFTLSNEVRSTISSKVSQSDIKDLLSDILSAPLYKLSSLLWNAIYFRIPISENSDNLFFYVQCDDLYPEETYDKNYEYISLPYNDEWSYALSGNSLKLGGTYLCRMILSPQYGADGYDGEIEVYKCNEDLLSGRWHYGTDLTHTEYTSQQTSIVAQKGDFYLNTNTYGVYYTLNGTGDWTYIGNLAGSIDASKWAQLNSPEFTGKPLAPTASVSDKSQQLATTEFVRNAIEQFGSKSVDLTGYAPLQNPHFTGIPTAPTPSTTNNSTQIATTEFVRDAIDRYSNSYNGAVVKINITGWSKQTANHGTYTTTAVLQPSTQFTPVTGVYYQFVFDNDVLAAISQESDADAGGVWDLRIGDTLCGGEMSGAGVGSVLSALQSATYYLYYETESNSLKTVLGQIINNAFKYADYLISTLKNEVNTQIQKLEARVGDLEENLKG